MFNLESFDKMEAELLEYEKNWFLFDEFNNGLQALADEEWTLMRYSIIVFFISIDAV